MGGIAEPEPCLLLGLSETSGGSGGSMNPVTARPVTWSGFGAYSPIVGDGDLLRNLFMSLSSSVGVPGSSSSHPLSRFFP